MSRFVRSIGLIFIAPLLLGVSAAQAMTATVNAYQRESAAGFDRSLELSVSGGSIRFMLSPSYVTASTLVVSAGGSPRSQPNTSFAGHVRGENKSWVRLSISENGINGVFSRHGHRFEIETASDGTISIEPLADNRNRVDLFAATRSRTIANAIAPQITRVAEIGIVVDSQYNTRFRGEGLDKALSIINAVDGIYREEFGLGLKVVKVLYIHDIENDPFNYGPIPIEQMLRNFRDYRMNSQDLQGVSLVHLFTGNPNTDEPVGLAWINTACRNDGYDVGISTPYRHDILLAAHEIAHNLGAQHDSDTACAAQQDKVMWPYISTNTSQHFSSCTLDAVNASLENSCHTETIDLQVSLKPSVLQSDTVTATIRNNDQLRSNPSATLSINLPQNSIASTDSSDCNTPENSLLCDIGTLLPGAEESITVQFGQIDNVTADVRFSVANELAADPHPENNLASLTIQDGLIATSIPQAADPTGGNAGADVGFKSGIGAIGPISVYFLSLACLFIFAVRQNQHGIS